MIEDISGPVDLKELVLYLMQNDETEATATMKLFGHTVKAKVEIVEWQNPEGEYLIRRLAEIDLLADGSVEEKG